MTHICFLALDYPTQHGGGGVGNQAQLLGRALVRRGFRVSVVTLQDSTHLDYWEDEGVAVYAVQPGSLHWYLSRIPILGDIFGLPVRELEYSRVARRVLRKIHQRHPIDLIEGSETGCLDLTRQLNRVPLVIRLHGEVYSFHKHTPGLALGPDLKISRWLQRRAIRQAEHLLSPSHVHAHEITQEIPKLKKPIRVIPNAVDLSRFALASSIANDAPVVLFSGRLEKRKGVDLLLQAAQQVLDRVPAAQFLLAGAPHISLDFATLQAFVQERCLSQNVRFLGHVPWKTLLTLYHRAQVFVLPSFYETFGIVALEAMATGTPVIGWKVGALPEVVEDGISGRLVPAGDVSALAQAIIDLLTHPDKRKSLGQTAQNQAAAFDLPNVLEQNLRFYEEVLKNAR